MARYVLINTVRGLLTLFAVSILVFFLARLTGDPLDVLAPVDMSREDEEALRAQWGLDKSLPEQYLAFAANASRGDFGPSFKYPTETAGSVILDRLPNSIKLGAVATVLTLIVGVPLGILSAVKRGSMVDRVAKGFALFGQSVPEFWLAIILIWVVAVRWHVVPTSGIVGWKSYILPSIVISIFGIAALLRLFRSAMLESLGNEYVKLARLKGLSESKVIWKHALKPASIAPLTFFGGIVVRMLTGATVVEIVFSWPGAGLLAYEAANARDFSVVQALALFTAAAIVIMNLLIDIAYAYIDPRVRLGQKAVV
ncbi:MAG TPA: ABC transporter permease [Acidimicrobiia bacterium]|nr:ABC transporter permease [Acidimicrobiia bacterium]